MNPVKINPPKGFEIDKEKSTLEEIHFKPTVKEKPETFEEAINMLPATDADVIAYNIDLPKHLKAYLQLVIITKVLNKGEKLDWKDSSAKYFNYFNMDDFSFVVYDFWLSWSNVSAALCFKRKEDAEYAAKKFLPIYKEYMQP